MNENIIKGWFTSILGAIGMGYAIYGKWFHHLSNIEALIWVASGFALLYMRDKISVWIEQAFKMLMNKFLK
jgi:hypothetical protein